jgi:hypothetical protein
MRFKVLDAVVLDRDVPELTGAAALTAATTTPPGSGRSQSCSS